MTDESQILTSSFPLHQCDGEQVKLYLSSSDSIFRLGEFIVQVTEKDVLQLDKAPEGVVFAEKAVVCDVQDVVKVCKENPRGHNHYAFSLNFERAGVKSFYTFSTKTCMVLSIKKTVKDGIVSIAYEWHVIDTEKEKIAEQLASFRSSLMIYSSGECQCGMQGRIPQSNQNI